MRKPSQLSFGERSVINSERVKTKHFRLNFAWKDEFLPWNASQAEGIDQLRLDLEDIWIPDIEVYNLVSRTGLRDKEQVDGHERTMFDRKCHHKHKSQSLTLGKFCLPGCAGELRRHPLGSPLHPHHHLQAGPHLVPLRRAEMQGQVWFLGAQWLDARCPDCIGEHGHEQFCEE